MDEEYKTLCELSDALSLVISIRKKLPNETTVSWYALPKEMREKIIEIEEKMCELIKFLK